RTVFTIRRPYRLPAYFGHERYPPQGAGGSRRAQRRRDDRRPRPRISGRREDRRPLPPPPPLHHHLDPRSRDQVGPARVVADPALPGRPPLVDRRPGEGGRPHLARAAQGPRDPGRPRPVTEPALDSRGWARPCVPAGSFP